MAVREVAFQLECFEWADEHLEVAGRWQGLAGRRLIRPVLSVDTQSGRRKRLVAMPGGHFGAAEESWRATFSWPGDPAEITGVELEVGGNVVVDLPLPDRRRRRRKRAPVDAGDEALRVEIAALRGQVERLRGELAGRERENMQLRAQLDEHEPAAVAEAGDATVEIERLAGEREELAAELARLAGERDRTRSELSAEVERLQGEHDRRQTEIDDLREAFSEAAAEAEAARDRHRAELASLQDELRAERATVARLTAELAEQPDLPPPATDSARRAAAAAPPTQPLPAPVVPAAAPEEPLPAVLEAASVPGMLDPPGPLRAGARPAAAGTEAGEQAAAGAANGDAVPVDSGRPAGATLHALKERLENLFASNGHAVEEEEEETGDAYEPVPGPVRTAAAARARAGATVAARRSAAELWGLRILAAVLVAVLLVAFVLILTSIA